MSISTPLIEIQKLYSLAFPTAMSMLVAEIAEVMPAAPSTGGSRQQIRIRIPGSVLVDVLLFDQAASLPMHAVGSVIRVSASPNAVRAIVWERSKAAKPTANVGVIVVRRQAAVEVLSRDQANMLGLTAYGAVVATPTQGMPVAPTRPPEVVQPSLNLSPQATGEPSALEIGRRFGECLAAARSALGPQADTDDVRATARVIYDEMYGRRAVA